MTFPYAPADAASLDTALAHARSVCEFHGIPPVDVIAIVHAGLVAIASEYAAGAEVPPWARDVTERIRASNSAALP